MTIALNILLAVLVFTGLVGLLAYNIFAARTRFGYTHTAAQLGTP